MKKVYISSGTIPLIPTEATMHEALAAFSSKLGIEGRVVFDDAGDNFNIRIHNPEKRTEELVIPSSFWNPNNLWPKFVFCTAHIKKNAPLEILSHWELLFLMLKERLDYSIRTDSNEIFLTYIRNDINLIKDYCVYTHQNSYNAELKMRNVVVLVDPYKSDVGSTLIYRNEDVPLGDVFEGYIANRKNVIAQTMKMFNVFPASESMLSKSGKIVVAMSDDGLEPTAAGFGINKDQYGDIVSYTTIFPRKSALPARFKTHIHGGAFSLISPDSALFLQDMIEDKDGNLVDKDDTLRNVIIVYERIEKDTYRLVGGEIEVTEKIGNQYCLMNRHIETAFDGIESLCVEAGKTYVSKNGFVKLGTSDGKPVFVENVYSIAVTSVQETGFSDSIRIDYVAKYHAGNSRITSHTGLKGVTKVMKTCGNITFEGKDGNEIQLEVDAIAGVNSIKAKENTIRLAQAAFAARYGFYTPKHPSGLLDSLDEDEINRAAASVPKVTYRRERVDGTVERVTKLYGLISISITEIGSHFATPKYQSISFNAVRYMYQADDKRLAECILNECVKDENYESVIELAKCIYDPGTSLIEDDKPIYTIKELARIFTEDDVIKSGSSIFPSRSKLLDPEFNKGFYINLGAQRSGAYMRIPPAEILNRFCGRQADGRYVYPGLILEASKVIDAAITGSSAYYKIAAKRSEDRQNRPSAYRYYQKALQGMLYKTELGGQKLVQSLIVPKLKGVNLKQMHDKYVPEGKIVILDDRLYNELRSYVYQNEDDFETVLIGEFSPFKAFTFRSPFLWKTQTVISEVWNREMFAKHLHDNYGFELEDYLSVQCNRFCALISTEIIRRSHSDLDGDLLQISTLQGKDRQDLMTSFQLSAVSEKMLKWDMDYLDSERSSVDDLDWTKPYKLTTVPVNMASSGDNSYADLLINSSSAKSAVGPGTNNAWVAGMCFELYYGMLKDKHPDVYVPWSKDVKKAIKLDWDTLSSIDHITTQANEVYVINAIKHIIGGALGYEEFMMKNIGSSDKAIKSVTNKIVNKMGYSKEEATKIIQLSVWAKENGSLDMMNAFLRMFNKGETERFDGRVLSFDDPEVYKWFELIVKHTFFGRMVAPVFNIYKQANGFMEVEGTDQKPAVETTFDI